MAIVLGSGLGGLVDVLKDAQVRYSYLIYSLLNTMIFHSCLLLQLSAMERNYGEVRLEIRQSYVGKEESICTKDITLCS